MTTHELSPEELEDRLGELHAASFGWALSCCGWNDADAEDVLQTVYLKIVSGRARFGGRSAFKTWLFGVIRQTAREQRRKAESMRERAVRFGRERLTKTASPAGTIEIEESEVRKTLSDALEQLADKQREVLHLVFYQDMSIREAAEVMEVSLGTARVHYDRGKKRLRTLLADRDLGGST